MAPLIGVRVLDVSRLLPGPYATRTLAELGADVIKIEDPSGGDYARWYPPLVGEPPMSGLFRLLNQGKKSVALDLRTPDGQHAFRKLIPSTDVLFDGFRPGVLTRLGLDPRELMEAQPRLIYCALTGFGLTGPDRDRAGHDIGYTARAGALALSGDASGPALPGVQLADMGGALAAVSGVLAALFERTRTGRGRVVDISLTESALSFASLGLGLRSAGHRSVRGRELLDGSRPAYAVYRTADEEHLAVGALEPKFWSAFVSVLGLEHLEGRGLETGVEGERVKSEVQRVLVTRPAHAWREAFSGRPACVEVVQDLDAVMLDPHLRARGAVEENERVAGPVRLADPAHAFEDAAASAPPTLSSAPTLGADTYEVLEAAGVEPEILARIAGRDPDDSP